MGALVKPSCLPYYTLLASAVAQTVHENPEIFDIFLWHWATSSFSSVWKVLMGGGKPQQRVSVEVASLNSCRNSIRNPKFENHP